MKTKKLLSLLAFVVLSCALPAFAQNARYDAPFPSVTSQYQVPFLVANTPGTGTPQIQVCGHPANQVPCTNYATTYTQAGAACPNGSQDTPQPQPSACQSGGDAQGNIGFWIPAGTYDYTVTVNNVSFGPYTITLLSGSAPATFQTNSVNNTLQTKLNLIPGTGITVTADAFGGDTIATSTSGSTAAWFWDSGDTIGIPPYANSTGNIGSGGVNAITGVQVNVPSITVSSVTFMIPTTQTLSAATVGFALYNAAGTTKLWQSGNIAYNSLVGGVPKILTFSPITLSAGTVLFVQSMTTFDGSVAFYIFGQFASSNNLLTTFTAGTAPRLFTAANSVSAGVFPATLGTLTKLSALNEGLVAALFQ